MTNGQHKDKYADTHSRDGLQRTGGPIVTGTTAAGRNIDVLWVEQILVLHASHKHTHTHTHTHTREDKVRARAVRPLT